MVTEEITHLEELAQKRAQILIWDGTKQIKGTLISVDAIMEDAIIEIKGKSQRVVVPLDDIEV